MPGQSLRVSSVLNKANIRLGLELNLEIQGLLLEPVPAKPLQSMWGFPRIRGTSLGAPIIRPTMYWGLY